MTTGGRAVPLLIGCYTTEAGGAGRGIVGTAVREDGSFEPVVDRTGDLASPSFLALHPRLPIVYAVSELESGVLTTYDAGAVGPLRQIDARPTGGSLPCHVAVDSDASFLAVAGYGDGSLSIFAIDEQGLPGERQLFHHAGSGPNAERQEAAHCHQVTFGAGLVVTDLGADRVRRYVLADDRWLAAPAGDVVVRQGSGPRHIVFDGDYRYVVDELQPGVTSYRVDPETRRWEAVDRAPYAGDSPSCLPSHLLLHEGFLYVANRVADSLSVLEAAEGRLRFVAEVPTGGRWPRHFELIGRTLVVANEKSDLLTSLLLAPGDPVPVRTPHSATTGAPTCVLVVPERR